MEVMAIVSWGEHLCHGACLGTQALLLMGNPLHLLLKIQWLLVFTLSCACVMFLCSSCLAPQFILAEMLVPKLTLNSET